MYRSNIVLTCFLVFGCHTESYDAIPTNQPDRFVASVQAAQRRMHARYVSARLMVESIARSDLDAAHSSAHVLASLDEPEALAIWRPYVESIQDAANKVERAGNLGAAARSAAILGIRCANCHIAIKARVSFAREPPPPADPKLAQEMVSHQWAATQMWQGLIAPSDDAWRAGAQALTSAPLAIVAQHGIPTFADDIDDVARVRLYGRRALSAMANDARADLYGDLLATCAHCHQILRDR